MKQSDSASGAPSTAENEDLAQEMALGKGNIVQELGYDEDIDYDFRDSLEAVIGEELLTEEDQEPADAVILWWRSDDGDVNDLTDDLVDAQRSLDGGPVWLLTPRSSQDGHVDPADVNEAADTAGLHATKIAGVSDQWSATRLENRRKN